jgi:hypothetical protein
VSDEPERRSGSLPRSRASPGSFDEIIRLVLVGLFTAGGWQIGQALDLQTRSGRFFARLGQG